MKMMLKTFWLSCLLLAVAPGLPAASSEAELTPELADRYELMLIRSPQPGSAFDRVIEWYSTQGGGLEVLQKRWQNAAKGGENTQAYLIVQGLLAERLRVPGDARKFYREAIAAGEPAPAARLLAALETTEGNFPAAAEAYQRALAGDALAPVDRMELMRAQALVYQRAFDDEKALAVWRDAMKRFPNDPYVLEEAGEAFLGAAQYAEARAAFTQLREQSARDPYRRIAASLRLGRTAEMEGKTADAVGIYEQALGETSEGSWINREVRGRIEELFRRKDDLPGLLAYYEKRTVAVPQDALAFADKAAVLQDLGRGNESVEALRQATQLAPGNSELRLELIRQLTRLNQADAALAEARELAKPADAAPEVVLVLGNLQWQQFESSKKPEDRAAAIETWRRIAPADSTDVARVAQLADLLAARELGDEAMKEWQRIVTLQPGAADARQRLAEAEVKRGNDAAARQVLADLIAGDRATSENFLKLARLQERMKWSEASQATLKQGLQKFPQDYELLNFAWQQALESGDASATAALFPRIWENAPNEFFAEEVIKRYSAALESGGKPREEMQALQKRVEADPANPINALVWFRLALAQKDEAVAKAALAQLKTQPNAVRFARASAEFAQAFGSPDDQVAALQAVASADPRLAADSLRAAARVQADSGKVTEALATLSGLIEKSPADASLYSLYAELAARAGKYADAVARLRESIRYVEDASALRLQLAAYLQAQGQLPETAQVLQEAFEKESREARRMDIFRRQIELAMQSGKIEELVASLKERQTKEQGGARYGTYLAEIFLLQGDQLAAKEELTRSLGRNPDNAAAVNKLLDLAERGGDREEVLRLSARLAELEPSQENRATYLAKLLDSGDAATAEAQLESVRAEIVKNPTAWNPVLMALRRAGLTAQFDELIGEIAAAASDPETRSAVAVLRLQQGDFATVEKELWAVVEAGGLADSLKAVISDTPPAQRVFGLPLYYLRFQSLQQLSNEVQNSLQLAAMPGRSGYFPRSRSLMLGQPTSLGKATPAQRAQVRALLMLGQLARAKAEEKPYFEKVAALFRREGVDRGNQYVLFSVLNYQEGVTECFKLQAEDPLADLETDKLMLSVVGATGGELSEPAEKIRARVEKLDPVSAYEQLFSQASAGVLRSLAQSGSDEDAAAQKAAREKLDALLKHPGRQRSPQYEAQLANLAARVGDLDSAFQLLEQSRQALNSDTSIAANLPLNYRQAQLDAAQAYVIARAIQMDDPRAQEAFEKWMAQLAAAGPVKSSGRFRSVVYYGMGMGGGNSPLATENRELVMGDSEFPLAIFQYLNGNHTPMPGVKMLPALQAWFAKRSKEDRLDPYLIGAFYSDWFAGKREEAVKRIAAIHAAQPTPRTAALLLEAYERLKAYDRALAVIDLAEMQATETPDVRELRRIRLLRLTGKTEEARKAAERLGRSRLTTATRNQMVNELNKLAIPLTDYPNLNPNNVTRSRPSRDRGEAIRLQVSKLVDDQKMDEAERIALLELSKPLPEGYDHERANLRSNLVSLLRRINRLEKWESDLQDRLAKDPGDADAGLRLMEAGIDLDNRIATDRMVQLIREHPERVTNLSYLIMLLQRRSELRPQAIEAIGLLLQTNPALFAKSGVDFNQMLSLASNPSSGAVLAEAVAGLSDADYRTIFFRSRLMGQMQETSALGQLAEFSLQAGKPEQAIKLLQRTLDEVMANPQAGIPSALRLAELQLEHGKKDDAAATLKTLFASSPRNIYSIGASQNTFGITLTNLLLNRSPGNSAENQIERIAKLAEATGTLELLLQQLEVKNQVVGLLSPSLLIRTYLKKPGIEKEWKNLAQNESGGLRYFNLPMLGTVLKVLADQPDSRKLMVGIIQKVSPESGGGSSEYGLRYLVEALPLLTKYRSDPVIQKHLQQIVSQILADPNGSRYLASSGVYSSALSVLVDHGYTEEAEQLLELTAAERASRNYGNREMFVAVEARLRALKGEGVNAQVVGVGVPTKDNQLKVRWTTNLQVEDGEMDDSGSSVSWEESLPPLAEAQRPSHLEVWAGPNPAALEKIAQVNRPELSGSVEAKVTAPLGLLQMKWKTRDGSPQWGPLTVYVIGKNLIERNGVPPPETLSTSGRDYRTGQPGPWGTESAVTVESLAARPELKVPLLEFEPGERPGLWVLAGWVRSGNADSNGSAPRIEIEMIRGNDRRSTDSPYFRSSSGAQWRQFAKVWSDGVAFPGANTMGKDVKQLNLAMRLNAFNGYNNQYQITGSWDGLQMVRLGAEPFNGKSQEWLSKARQAFQKKEFGPAAEAFLAALRLNPQETLQQNAVTLFDAFRDAGRLPELFTVLSAPALYLPDPLRNQQPSLQNQKLISLLAQEAFRPEASAEAKAWLAVLQKTALPERLQFLMDVTLLKEEIARDPAKLTAERVLNVAGWREKDPNLRRIREFWVSTQTEQPTPLLLALLDTPEKRAAVLALLPARPIPAEYQAAQRQLEAWLTAPENPARALELWKQGLGLRRSGPNSVSVQDDADRLVLLKIMATNHPSNEMVVAVQVWLDQNNPDSSYRKRLLVELWYAAQKNAGPNQAEYGRLWQEAEMAALKTPNYNASRDRVRELSERLRAAGEWEQLEQLFDSAEKMPSLKSSPLLTEFAQMRAQVAFGKGDLSGAWPVTWFVPATPLTQAKVHWQWNLKTIKPEQGLFDVAIAVADREIRKDLPGQQAVEIWFGEMPGELKLLQRIEGDAASGSTEVTLPSRNGFLRAVAVLADRRVPGPLTPVVSGRRIFPAESSDLKTLLASGSEPLSPDLLTDAGPAPDGSPAVRIGNATDNRSFNYAGPVFPVESGKFYVLRNWVHRAGNGGFSNCVEYQPVKTSSKGSLSMLLSERPDLTGRWVLLMRAVPTLPQHTFWIPFKEVENAVPRLWDAASGTELAGWELIEVDGWKYAQWLTELALLRETAATPPSEAELARAVELARIEPLTALDYHGQWLAEQLSRTGQSAKLLQLYEVALAAEPNPLFSRPKLNRIFSSVNALIDDPQVPDSLKWEALQLVLRNRDRLGASPQLAFQRRQLTLAKKLGREAEVRGQLITELNQILEDPKRAPGFLTGVINQRTYRQDRPISEFLALCLELNDAALLQRISAELTPPKLPEVDAAKKSFVGLALEVGRNPLPSGEEWKRRVARAFASTEKLPASEDYLFWPAVLGDALIERQADPELLLELRTQAFERAKRPPRNPAADLKELIRAGEYLIEAAASHSRPELAAKTADEMKARLAKFSEELSDDTLGMIRRSMDHLTALGDTVRAQGLFELIQKQVRKRPAVKESFAKYLEATPPPAAPSPSP